MKNAAILLCLFLCGTVGLWAISVSSEITVGGDVPRPGTIAFEDVTITLHEAVEKSGLDLRPFYIAGNAKVMQCPIRVTIHRVGETRTYDPQKDAEVFPSIKVGSRDVIEVKDFRKHPDKIRERTKRLDEMLSLGSTEVGDEIEALAGLRREHTLWVDSKREKHESLAVYIRREYDRITEEGKGEKVAKLLKLRRSALILAGLGPSHPTVMVIDDQISMLDDTAKTIKEANPKDRFGR